jgi:16S rRNA processing protein RimM
LIAHASVERQVPVASTEDGESTNKVVVLGRIVGAFGIGGWVKVESFTEPPQNILRYPMWQLTLKGQSHTRKHLEGRMTAKGVQVRIEGVADRTDAELWRGAEIGVARSELPTLKAGEYYWDDLIGLQAHSPNGEVLGNIVDIRATPAHPVLLIRGEAAEAGKPVEYWVPLAPQYLKSVDLKQRTATLEWYRDWA